MSSVATESEMKLAVLEELHRAFDSGLDGASERQRGLLSYLVTEELEGRGERIKAYSIATEVFGRAKDFDPQQDSIVRVEVGRLR
jgi:adenylate cyclase